MLDHHVGLVEGKEVCAVLYQDKPSAGNLAQRLLALGLQGPVAIPIHEQHRYLNLAIHFMRFSPERQVPNQVLQVACRLSTCCIALILQ